MTLESVSITVVIPTLNDSEALGGLLAKLRTFQPLPEIRVADGGSGDVSQKIAESLGAIWILSERGRGRQLNAGAKGCSNEILWFLHADNVPRAGSIAAILEALEEEAVVGGALRFQLSEPRWYGPLFHLFINLRSKVLGLPYGDQGYFVRREVFERIGGFSTDPILEDVDFIRRLRKVGRIVFLPTPIGVSPRRWDREGVLRRTLLNWGIMLGYFLGIPPKTLARFYSAPRNRRNTL